MTWETVAIGTVIRSSQYGLSLPANPDGDMPIVGMKDIQNSRVRIDSTVCVSLSDEEAHDYLLKDGDILLNRTNSPDLVGKAGIYRGAGKAVFASYLVRLELDHDRADPDYVIQILASESGQRHIKQLATRAISQANLNPTTFKNHFYIPLPALNEQIGIRDILLGWDIAIEKTERLIAAKLTRLQAIAHQVLTARKRINGFPNRWQFVRADSIFENISRKGFMSEPLLSVTQERGVIPRDMLEGRVTMPAGDTDSFKLVEPGNFVISLRSFQGGLEHSAYRGLVSPAYTVLQATREIDERFFRQYFKSVDFIKRLSVAVIGIRDGKQISFQDFCSIKLPFPPVAEQRAIGEMLDHAEREISLLRDQAAALSKQKRGLMQKLLTGQWRVNASGKQKGSGKSPEPNGRPRKAQST